MLKCRGLLTDAKEADQRWVHMPQKNWVHFIVKLDDNIIDLTRRQFFPLSAFPFIQPYSDCMAEWGSVSNVQ
jgi:hypothetical protein